MRSILLIVVVFIALITVQVSGCSQVSAPEPAPPQPPLQSSKPPSAPPVPPQTPAATMEASVPVVGYRAGNLAPSFKFQGIGGSTIALRDLQGSPVVLNFWATWCGPCRMEMPLLQQLYESDSLAKQGLKVLTINTGEPQSKVDDFLSKSSFSFPVLLDSESNLAHAYNIRGLPTTFFINRLGIIRDVQIGAFTNWAQIEQKLWKILS